MKGLNIDVTSVITINSVRCSKSTQGIKHEGVHSASNSVSLIRYKKIKHEWIRYRCDQCDYGTSDLSNLKGHKESKQIVNNPVNIPSLT